ncbi:uncharacterized protein LOC108227072 [Daucus carota subsp. sativus]|uniref:Uncharacterized protein n=1 Tax=Daucus carota subsp. sativus TaxID=79200 RepID=A0A164VPN6_DAUCS|nr:PREDICTED: uncharacterized protein LOC108227072 [Daucus carota subsp. sativus]
MAFRGSISRTLMTAARSSPLRSPTPLLRQRLPSLAAPRPHSSRFAFINPRVLGELGTVQPLSPMFVGSRLTSHLAVNPRACIELSHVT